KESTKWLENKWAQIEGVSYEPAAIGQGVELETALRKLANTDAAKKEAGKKELEAIIHEERSQFLEVARKILAEKTKPETETPQPQSESKSSESHDAHKGEEHGNP
ncbi:MAG TPA: hypothetical protein PLY93_10820, partial [Turneriella sp.]|nr:hypothetical protein [Turneriella sp.]